ncbi:hypothetical protein [Phaeobacter sp. 22II1-1F12B]|uniref:hypothetical protein n=1 Tax=Phaeobacter sp. 22II1-1F12B TaxID=1317111 RepID=UPI000B52731F|nr:hypothetical protein [Phaeobacter sp. 22II1-1F12B]OWU79040.1 hypothetical protein ATO1_13200 [Phaeobacter sp. 22II1-1F12B]
MNLTRTLAVLLSLSILAACGADGEPVQPTVSGGVSVSRSGVHATGGVGLNRGPFSVFLGL